MTVGTEEIQAHALRQKALRNGGGRPPCLHCDHRPKQEKQSKNRRQPLGKREIFCIFAEIKARQGAPPPGEDNLGLCQKAMAKSRKKRQHVLQAHRKEARPLACVRRLHRQRAHRLYRAARQDARRPDRGHQDLPIPKDSMQEQAAVAALRRRHVQRHPDWRGGTHRHGAQGDGRGAGRGGPLPILAAEGQEGRAAGSRTGKAHQAPRRPNRLQDGLQENLLWRGLYRLSLQPSHGSGQDLSDGGLHLPRPPLRAERAPQPHLRPQLHGHGSLGAEVVDSAEPEAHTRVRPLMGHTRAHGHTTGTPHQV